MNVPPFPPTCLTSLHATTTVKCRRTADLDAAIQVKVRALARDPSLFVLGVIYCGSREAVIVSQKPVGAQGNIALSAVIRDKEAR